MNGMAAIQSIYYVDCLCGRFVFDSDSHFISLENAYEEKERKQC